MPLRSHTSESSAHIGTTGPCGPVASTPSPPAHSGHIRQSHPHTLGPQVHAGPVASAPSPAHSHDWHPSSICNATGTDVSGAPRSVPCRSRRLQAFRRAHRIVHYDVHAASPSFHSFALSSFRRNTFSYSSSDARVVCASSRTSSSFSHFTWSSSYSTRTMPPSLQSLKFVTIPKKRRFPVHQEFNQLDDESGTGRGSADRGSVG